MSPHTYQRLPRTLLGAGIALLSACGRSERAADTSTGGTLVISATSDPDALVPPIIVGSQGRQVADLLFDRLAEIGDALETIGDGGFRPRLARQWHWAADSMSIAFALDPRARWHDGRPVRASDVRFSFRYTVDSALVSSVASTLTNVDSVSVADSLTAVVWFHHRAPEQFFDIVYNLAILPEHLLRDVRPDSLRTSAFARHPVGSGRFRFAMWEPGARLEVVADTTNYRGRPGLDRVIWTVAPDPTTAATRVLTGEADLIEVLRRENVDAVRSNPALAVVTYPSFDYGFVAFNLRDPKDGRRPHRLFADRQLRRALSLAVDRAALVRAVLDTMAYVGLGPFTRAQATADTTIAGIAFDSAHAAALFDSLGWRMQGAQRMRGRTPLGFTLLVPTSSATRMRMAVVLQEQLRKAGVGVVIEQLDANAFFARVQAHRFDAIFNLWRTDPSVATIRQVWGSPAATRGDGGGGGGDANYGGYANPAFDALIDSGSRTFDPTRQRVLYRKAYETIVDDAPAIWVYELRNAAAMHRRLQRSGVRADAWWAGLPDWSVPGAQRIARDRIGLRSAGTP